MRQNLEKTQGMKNKGKYIIDIGNKKNIRSILSYEFKQKTETGNVASQGKCT